VTGSGQDNGAGGAGSAGSTTGAGVVAGVGTANEAGVAEGSSATARRSKSDGAPAEHAPLKSLLSPRPRMVPIGGSNGQKKDGG
jgi:hypothetical protein